MFSHGPQIEGQSTARDLPPIHLFLFLLQTNTRCHPCPSYLEFNIGKTGDVYRLLQKWLLAVFAAFSTVARRKGERQGGCICLADWYGLAIKCLVATFTCTYVHMYIYTSVLSICLRAELSLVCVCVCDHAKSSAANWEIFMLQIFTRKVLC